MSNLIESIKTNCTSKNGVIQHQMIRMFLRNNPELEIEFTSKSAFLVNGESLTIKFKAIENGITSYDNCHGCGKKLKKIFRVSCSKKCSAIITRCIIKEKYGVDSPFCVKEFKEKSKMTNLKKYGVENPQQCKEIREKTKTTNLKKYGFEYTAQNKEIREKMKKTNLEKYGVEHALQNVEIKEKMKETNLEKYGTCYTSQNSEVREKMKKTNLEKYGSISPLGSKLIQEKCKKTIFEKYGVSNVFQSEAIKEKIKITHLEKYGVENPAQNLEIRDKIRNTCLTKYGYRCYLEYINETEDLHYKLSNKEFIWPSGKVDRVQGYEPIVINELLEIYNENEILILRREMPVFKYVGLDNKEHR